MATPLSKLLIVLYLRLSRDEVSKGEKILDLVARTRAYFEGQYPDATFEVYYDNAMSGAVEDEDVRPDWNKVIDRVKRGGVNILATRDLSRFYRNTEFMLRFNREVMKPNGVECYHTMSEGKLDPVKDEFMLTTYAANATQYVTKCKVDSAAALQGKADKAEPVGNNVFGYRHGEVDGLKTLIVQDDEAAWIHKLYDAAMNDESYASMIRSLDAAGMTGRHGGAWCARGIRQMLMSPMLTGRQIWKDEIIAGNWTPILTVAESEAFVAKHRKPRKIVRKNGVVYQRTSTTNTSYRKHLLSGYLFDQHGVPMRSHARHYRDGTKAHGYQTCPRAKKTMGVTDIGVSIRADVVEELVLDEISMRLANPEVRVAMSTDLYATDRSAAAAALATAEEDFAAVRETPMPVRTKAAMLADAEAVIDAAQAALDDVPPPPPEAAELELIMDDWESASLADQRKIINRLIDKVTVSAVGRGRRNVDLSKRIDIAWRVCV